MAHRDRVVLGGKAERMRAADRHEAAVGHDPAGPNDDLVEAGPNKNRYQKKRVNAPDAALHGRCARAPLPARARTLFTRDMMA